MNPTAPDVVEVEEKRTELFALKLPKNEKDAMNFIADEKGATLATWNGGGVDEILKHLKEARG
jgi:hypothetical protein